MRIAHVASYFQPEIGYQETFLLPEQSRLGHDVYMITSDRYDPFVFSDNKDVLGSRLRDSGFFIENGINVWRLKTLFEIAENPWMLGLESKIRELEPDTVYVHGIVSLAALRIARLKKKMTNFKLVYDDHMTFGNSYSKLRILYHPFKWTFSHLIQEAADGLVGVGYPSKMFMNKRYGIPLERIVVIPLGADDELFRLDDQARQEIRKQLSLNANDIVFIYTGKIRPFKRLELLIEAVKLVKDRHQLKVLLVGSDTESYIEQLKREIKAENLEGRFIWHNMVPNRELYKYYSAADVAVWPHGASISQREAMACSLPIIISQDSMVTELVDNNNGFICQEDDALDLAQQMEKLLDPELRREMGANGRKLIEEKLNWKVIARQFIELVE